MACKRGKSAIATLQNTEPCQPTAQDASIKTDNLFFLVHPVYYVRLRIYYTDPSRSPEDGLVDRGVPVAVEAGDPFVLQEGVGLPQVGGVRPQRLQGGSGIHTNGPRGSEEGGGVEWGSSSSAS